MQHDLRLGAEVFQFGVRLGELILQHHQVRAVLIGRGSIPDEVGDFPRGRRRRLVLEALYARPQTVVRSSPQFHGDAVTVRRFELLPSERAVVFLILGQLSLHPLQIVLEAGYVLIASVDLVFEGVALGILIVVVGDGRGKIRIGTGEGGCGQL